MCEIKSVLLIEDDDHLRTGITYSLEKEKYAVYPATSLHEGEGLFHTHNPHLIILDLNLPDGDGIDFCSTIRKTSNIPILMLTARDMETDELMGFNVGADDYMTKPFSIAVLRARVASMMRRVASPTLHIIHSGEFKLDLHHCKFYRNDIEINISTTEFRLLSLLMHKQNTIVTKEEIISALWHKQEAFIDDNALSVNISRLRAKIEDDPKKPTVIKTVFGVGYSWVC